MSIEQEATPEQTPPGDHQVKLRIPAKTILVWFLNLVIAVLLVWAGYLYHDVVEKQRPPQTQQQPVVEKKIEQPKLTPVPQIDILNASTGKGVAARFTKYLRDSGFDVVEMKNFSYSHLTTTKVIDRLGNLKPAHDIADALGVADSNVIQQLNPDYMVDVSVVIGEDFVTLRPSRDTKK